MDKVLGTKTVKVQTLDGPKIYKFTPLKARRGQEVFHKTVRVLLGTIGGAIGPDGGTEKLFGAIADIDFGTIHELARELLTGCEIKPDPNNLSKFVIIDDIDSTDYFDDNNEELYIAIYHALRVSYPKSFSRLEKGFGRNLGAMMTKLKTPSNLGTPTSSPSQDSTE